MAFVLRFGLYEFPVLLFGLYNTPSIFLLGLIHFIYLKYFLMILIELKSLIYRLSFDIIFA